MSISHIDIGLKENKKFALIAFLVDKDEFLNDINEFRNSKGIITPYNLPDIAYPEISYVVDSFKKGIITISQVRTLLQEFCLSKKIPLSALDEQLSSAYMYAEALMKKYHKNRLYLPAILASILTGKVQEADFMSTYVVSLDSNTMNESLSANLLLSEWAANKEELIAIVVSPDSTKKEVEDLFTWLQQYRFGKKKVVHNDHMAEIMKDKMSPYKSERALSEITRDREWYWQKKDDKRPVDIAISCLKKTPEYHKKARRAMKYQGTTPEEKQKRQEYEKYLRNEEDVVNKVKQAIKRYKIALKSRYT